MALPRRRVIPVSRTKKPAAKKNPPKRRVTPKPSKPFRARQAPKSSGGDVPDKPSVEVSYAPTPAQKYAVKPGDPNYRKRTDEVANPSSKPMTPPQQAAKRELEAYARKMQNKGANPTSSKLARRRAIPVNRKMPTPNPYGTPQYGANMQPIGRASEYEIARYEAEQAMKRGLEPIPSGYTFANPRLDPNYVPPPMTPPQQDMLRRLFSSYNNAVNTGYTRPLTNNKYNKIFGSLFGRRP
jgi:hypothetical protein